MNGASILYEFLMKLLSICAKTGEEEADNFLNAVIKALNDFQVALAKKQISLAFQQAQKELDDLHQRTSEGIETARLAGKQIGGIPGKRLRTKKSIVKKEEIRKVEEGAE